MTDFDPSPPHSYAELVKLGYITPVKFPSIKKQMKNQVFYNGQWNDVSENVYYSMINNNKHGRILDDNGNVIESTKRGPGERIYIEPKKQMKKLIPFDIEKARKGAKVVTEKGHEVTILTYEGRALFNKIIGTYIDESDEIVSRWSRQGEGIQPGGLSIMIEEEETPKGYHIQGDALMHGNDTIGVFFLNHGNDGINKHEFLTRIAIALNAYDRNKEVFAIRYDPAAEHKIEYSKKGKEVLTLRSKIENLQTELDRITEEAKKWAAQYNDEVKKREELEVWKNQQLKVSNCWDDVVNFIVQHATVGDWGRPVCEIALERLKAYDNLMINREH
jgi:hypothetical protein